MGDGIYNVRGSTVRALEQRIQALKNRAKLAQEELQVAEAALAGALQAEASLKAKAVSRG